MKSFFSIVKSEKGSVILMAMMAFTFVIAGGYMVMRSSENANKSIKTNLLNDDMADLLAQINKLLSSSTACQATLGGLNARSSGPRTAIADHAGTSQITSTMKFGTGGVSIQTVRLEDGASDDVSVVTGGPGTTYAIVTFGSQIGSFFTNRNPQKRIKIWVNTDAADVVTACHSMSNAVDSAWSREAPTENINYATGNVGVGVVSPTEKMDVNGWVSASTTAGERISIGGTATEYQLSLNANKPLIIKHTQTPTMADIEVNGVRADGRIVLKPVVDASPFVPPVRSGMACSATYEGAMRSRHITIRANNVHGSPPLSLLRTQVCSDFGGIWKWRTLKVRKFTRGAPHGPCVPALWTRNCIDNSPTDQ